MKKRISLRKAWFGLIAFITLLPLLILIPWLGSKAHSILLKSALLKQTSLNKNIGDHLENEVSRIITVLENKSDPIAYILIKGKNYRFLQELLEKVLSREESIDSICLFKKDGRIIAKSDRHLAEKRNTPHGSWSCASTDPDLHGLPPEVVIPLHGRTYIGPTHMHDGMFYFHIAIPVGPIKRPTNVLMAKITTAKLWKALKERLKRPDIVTYLINERGGLITPLPGTKYMVGANLTKFDIVRGCIVRSIWRIYDVYQGIAGVPVFGSNVHIMKMNWGLISEIPEKNITGPIAKTLLIIMVIVSAMFILLGGLGMLIVNQILKPVTELTYAFDYLSRGDYSRKIPSSSIKEIDSLSTGFNRMSSDIHEREKELKESEEKYHKLLETANDAIFIANTNTGIILEINKQAENLLGLPREKIIGMHQTEFHPKEKAEDYGNIFQQAVQQGQGIVFDLFVVHKDGHYIPVDISTSVTEWHGQMIIQGLFRDVTERKQAEEERKRLNRELIVKNKELEQIVYVTSHDLRSPLVNIHGFSKELQHDAKKIYSVLQDDSVPARIKKELADILTKDMPESLTFILSSISKMDILLSGLLKISQFGLIKLTKIQLDMNTLIADVLAGFEFQIKQENITVQIDDLPSTHGDKAHINQLFSNLLGNAIKYLDPKREGKIKISGKKDNRDSIYCIEDNGIGIDREHHDKMFEIFHRLNPDKDEGEGLGLSIVKKILDRHSGKIWVESEPGKGSRFFVSLPGDKG